RKDGCTLLSTARRRSHQVLQRQHTFKTHAWPRVRRPPVHVLRARALAVEEHDLSRTQTNAVMLDQITPLILTYNEAPNIARSLGALSWACDIVLVDSFSDDDTVTIAKSVPQVRVFQRAFDGHRNQWEFGLKETGISTPWVLALDADYVLSDEVIAELTNLS